MENTLYTHAGINTTQGGFIESTTELSGRGILFHGMVNDNTRLYTVTGSAYAKLQLSHLIITKQAAKI